MFLLFDVLLCAWEELLGFLGGFCCDLACRSGYLVEITRLGCFQIAFFEMGEWKLVLDEATKEAILLETRC